MRLHRALLALTLLAPAAAAADTAARFDQGIDGCYSTIGDGGRQTAEYLADAGWNGDADDEMGLGWLYPEGSEDPFITVAVDGSFCQIESARLGSEAAAGLLRTYLEAAGQDFDPDKDEMGCTRFDLGDGYAVTITSGGDDPTCASDKNSALRFTYE